MELLIKILDKMFDNLSTNEFLLRLSLAMLVFMAMYYVYKKFIVSKLQNIIMKEVHKRIELQKTKLFEKAIGEIKSCSSDRRTEVLEIGIGTGENFKNFPLNSNVNILDRTDDFLPFLKESFKVREDLQIEKLIVSPAECMKDIETGSMDMVVHTFILCSVDDPKLVLSEIYRVLKPGGVWLFFEHSLDVNNKLVYLIQKLIGLPWYLMMDCKFLHIKSIIDDSVFDNVKMNEDNLLGFLTDPAVFGYGSKSISR